MQMAAKARQKLKTLNVLMSPKHLYYDPTWLILGVNNLCNLHCKMCDVGVKYNQSNFYENLMGSRPLNMPLELINRILSQAAGSFPQVKIGYAFTEPLIYPHLISSLTYANDLGLFTSVTTNALNLAQKAEELSSAGLNELYVSLDGPPEVHNFIRGHKSSFQRALNGIHKVLECSQHPDVSVFCVITEWNFDQLNAFLDLFEELPLKQIGFMHTNFTTPGVAQAHNIIYGDLYPATSSNMTEVDLDGIKLDRLLSEILRVQDRKFPIPITFSPTLSTLEELEQFYRDPGKIIGKRCNDAFSNLMIKSNGDVIPAHGRCYNLTIGNVYEKNLEDIWNDLPIANFRQTLVAAGGLLPACARCCSAF